MRRLLRYLHPLEKIKRQRKQYLATLKLPSLLAQTLDQPYPEIDDAASDMDYIVLDFETTGLDSEQDQILSIGWVCIHRERVDLESSKHFYIDEQSQVKPETAVINHITPQMLSGGVSIHDAMLAFFEAAKGKVIVAHGCVVEANFMNQYLQRYYHVPRAPFLWLDTLCIDKKLAKALNQDQDLDLTLAAMRERYGLPEYNNHNALVDAVSTAELLLAIQKRVKPDGSITFGHLYRLSQ